MSSIRRRTRLLSAATLVIGLAGLSSPAAGAERPAAGALRGSGTWQRQDARAAAQRWSVDLDEQRDGTVQGTVHLDGSRLASRATLQGQISGRRIRGALTDAAGNHLATFHGLRSASGTWSGTYEDRSGEVGRWSWNGR